MKDDLKRIYPNLPNQELNIVLPLAVSVNHLYMFKRGKRFMTKKGQDYMQLAMKVTEQAVELQNYVLEDEGVWLVCELRFYFPDKRRRDCHNQHKLILDALEYNAFKEDRWVLVRDMYVGLDKEFPRVEIKIYPSLEGFSDEKKKRKRRKKKVEEVIEKVVENVENTQCG